MSQTSPKPVQPREQRVSDHAKICFSFIFSRPTAGLEIDGVRWEIETSCSLAKRAGGDHAGPSAEGRNLIHMAQHQQRRPLMSWAALNNGCCHPPSGG